MKFLKGMVVGIATAATVGMIVMTMGNSTNKRKLKRSANRAVHAIGDVVDNMQNIVMP